MTLKITDFENFVWKISLLLLCIILLPYSAHAHKIKIFATATDTTITGSVYYPGGAKYRHGTLEVYSPDNQLLGQSKTNENGEFSFTATFYSDHIFTITTQDGHRSQYTVPANELPADLPLLDHEIHSDAKASAATDNIHQVPIKKSSLELSSIHPNELQKIISTIVAKQVNPLRKQIEQYEQKTRLRDVFGGIGYILGIAGVAFYFLGRNKFQRSNQ